MLAEQFHLLYLHSASRGPPDKNKYKIILFLTSTAPIRVHTTVISCLDYCIRLLNQLIPSTLVLLTNYSQHSARMFLLKYYIRSCHDSKRFHGSSPQ